MLVIIYGLDLDWPDSFLVLYNNTEPIAEAPQQFISFDCFLDKRTDTNLDANSTPLYFIRVIIACLIPVLVILISLAFWNLMYIKYRRATSELDDESRAAKLKYLAAEKKRRIVSTILVIMIFIHPSLSDILLEMFNCTEINGKDRLEKEIDLICYEGKHLTYTLFLVIPCCIIWVLGVPIYSFFRVRLNQRFLGKVEVKEEIGYLYNGYLKHASFWETIIILKKTAMVGIGAFFGFAGKKVQAQFTFGLLMVSALVHIWVKPYATMNLNMLEFASIMALTLSALAGVFYVTDESNNVAAFDTRNGFTLEGYEKNILYLLFILSNVFFFIYWGVLYIMELKRFLRVKFPKVYYIFFLCFNEMAVSKEKKNRDKFLRQDNTTELYIDAYDTCLKTSERLKKRVKYKNLLPILGIAKLGKNYVRMKDVRKFREVDISTDRDFSKFNLKERAEVYVTEHEGELPILDFDGKGTNSSFNKSKGSNSSKGLLKSKTNKVVPIGIPEEDKDPDDTLNRTQNELLNENRTLSDIEGNRTISEMNPNSQANPKNITDQIIQDINSNTSSKDIPIKGKPSPSAQEPIINPTFNQEQFEDPEAGEGPIEIPNEDEEIKKMENEYNSIAGDKDLGEGDLEDSEEEKLQRLQRLEDLEVSEVDNGGDKEESEDGEKEVDKKDEEE